MACERELLRDIMAFASYKLVCQSKLPLQYKLIEHIALILVVSYARHCSQGQRSVDRVCKQV
jgi:hypothetical protein